MILQGVNAQSRSLCRWTWDLSANRCQVGAVAWDSAPIGDDECGALPFGFLWLAASATERSGKRDSVDTIAVEYDVEVKDR